MKYEVLGNFYFKPVKSFSSKKRAFEYAVKHSNHFVRSFSSRTGDYVYYDALRGFRLNPFFVKHIYQLTYQLIAEEF